MTKLFLDILDENRKSVFSRLQSFRDRWVLAGGTALSLQIGHRQSYDFDLFSLDPIPRTLYRRVCEVFEETPTKLVDSNDQLTVALASGVNLTLLYYWYPAQFPTLTTNTLPLFDMRDIAADKAATLGRRNVWRDYVDLYALVKNHHTTLEEIIDVATKKFGNEFSPKLFLEQVAYTKDIRDTSVTWIWPAVTTEEIRTFLEQEAVACGRRLSGL